MNILSTYITSPLPTSSLQWLRLRRRAFAGFRSASGTRAFAQRLADFHDGFLQVTDFLFQRFVIVAFHGRSQRHLRVLDLVFDFLRQVGAVFLDVFVRWNKLTYPPRSSRRSFLFVFCRLRRGIRRLGPFARLARRRDHRSW